MRGPQTSGRFLMAAKAMTGLQVAPTAPNSIDFLSSSGSAESFQSAVLVFWAAHASGAS
ncbi:hypothetical protein [Arthrobacter methylotrophus]|uniref:hypothetical protein n=1 Tax=Arthrobacter methylotrophus TaxID=121291 RepID=UPI0031EEF092